MLHEKEEVRDKEVVPFTGHGEFSGGCLQIWRVAANILGWPFK